MVKSRSWLGARLAVLVLVAAATLPVGCAGGIPPAIERVAVRIAEDVCTEVLNATVPAGGVQLSCTTNDGKTTVAVTMPRAQWAAIKRASVDAGPGL